MYLSAVDVLTAVAALTTGFLAEILFFVALG
jgi:hypothetical protein